ncbi:preprotein translocase subunit SecA [Candidatus Riesia sp. GBBU]|nr:preprotein translocase subunit SecA [Candidatus Riesia sp. GBBU]
MFSSLLAKIFGSRNDRTLKNLKKTVKKINFLENKFEKLSNRDLQRKTDEFRNRIKSGEKLNNLIPEVFATVREASKRILKIRHFDVQLIGGIVLNKRCVAEMRTGEGKTLTATLPAYLHALTGNGVHIVTINEYLAKRDAENNRPLFEFLGITVGINLSGMSRNMKKKAYSMDITYGTNNEYGFDYLRDNMILRKEDRVQRGLYYALIDEVDSILIDEARTPLIISGPLEYKVDLYEKIDHLVHLFIREDLENFKKRLGHFTIDEKLRQINLTEHGLELIETLLIKLGLVKKRKSIYSSKNIILVHHFISALRAHHLFKKNVDYLVKNGKVLIIDEHTGRVMKGRHWSDGLHQAIEAKEKLKVNNENQTLASITFQNYFRLYKKLAGMTGTADTEAVEFKSIYQLETVVIPTNCPMIREDLPDLVYMTEREKISAIIKDIKNRTSVGQPVLVGTISIEKSELISRKLRKENIPHEILNAKFHSLEAEIISKAGMYGAVTIATNMAGRGTDIVLGGNYQNKINKLNYKNKSKIREIKLDWKKSHDSVLKAGGLHIIGTERHESRRIDNQLRGRSGRQGDPGSSQFYLSLEDSLMRIFALDKVKAIIGKFKINSGEAIEHPWITKAIANAQKKVENYNFDIRKQLLEYDDVSNDQRCAIYLQRDEILHANDISKIIDKITRDVIKKVVIIHYDFRKSKYKFLKLERKLLSDFDLNIKINQLVERNTYTNLEIVYKKIIRFILNSYKRKQEIIGASIMRNIEKEIMIQTLDSLWREHLFSMENLRQGIHLRGYIQVDPKQEYKKESFLMFSNMIENLKYDVVSTISKMKIESIEDTLNLLKTKTLNAL